MRLRTILHYFKDFGGLLLEFLLVDELVIVEVELAEEFVKVLVRDVDVHFGEDLLNFFLGEKLVAVRVRDYEEFVGEIGDWVAEVFSISRLDHEVL
jgi:hypothetical protein